MIHTRWKHYKLKPTIFILIFHSTNHSCLILNTCNQTEYLQVTRLDLGWRSVLPLQAGGEFGQGLKEVWGSSGGLLAETLPSPAQLSLLDVTILNLPEQLRHHLTNVVMWGKRAHSQVNCQNVLKFNRYGFGENNKSHWCTSASKVIITTSVIPN